jgi:hypothetical protein
LVFLADQKLWQSNTNLEWCFTVWIPKFKAVLFFLFISQAFVCLWNHDELCMCFRVVRIAVRM